MTNANPLLQPGFDIPFDRIRAEHVEPAVDELLASARAAIEAIASSADAPTYANTLGALDDATEGLEFAMTIVGHLESVCTYPELRAAFNAVQPKVSAFSSSIPTHPGLWKALRAFSETPEAANLDPTRARFLEKTLQEFRRHGADLSPEDKAKLEKLDVELSEVTTRFSQNSLDATTAWDLVVTEEAKLAGLPESAVAAARQSAESRGVEGWRFTLQAPSVVAVLTYLDDAEIREAVWRAFNTRATRGELDNRPLIARILDLRQRKAELLGYADFSDLVLEDRMAKTGARARAFVDGLADRCAEPFAAEQRELNEFRRALEGPDAPEIEGWDVGYYAEKLRMQRFDFDEEELRPYFSAERVVQGAFEVAKRLYGVEIQETDVAGWHEDVRAYRMVDANGRHMASFWVDLYPRDNKRDGAWMNSILTSIPNEAGEQPPQLGYFCANVTPPVGDAHALLTHREVETIFHEFGHLMHHCVHRVTVRSLAGTNVAWDFVELPSQIMENWCWEREALDLFARHHETNEPIPDALFERMVRARTFRSASMMMRQLGFGTMDLALHRDYDPARDGDVVEYAREISQRFAQSDLPKDYAMVASFGHLFGSPVGYGAAYYSYMWAEVLDADAFARFKEEGIFDRNVGRDFLALLSKGDSQDPMDLFVAFRGREPSDEALFARKGLLAAAS